jgi:hypothetical protein
VLQFLILWDRNDYYIRFNLPFAVSILFKTLQVLIASASHSGLVYIFILYFVGRPCNEVMRSNSLGMKVAKTYRKDCTLYWDVYIICNTLILSDYCVTIKNELHVTFLSLGSEVAKCSILSGRIGRVPVNSTEWHQVNASCKFRISA